eukprot:TRINITY_DN1124_c0_g2_i14.p2 TRINITY_DN1124_c0_g2~~TRINITY_DN1124_c0_g2_i14.p2  ORF type:complete len:130 (-),score=16.64 TRINITY_DN1124_c0_g2_i14:348-737(-)
MLDKPSTVICLHLHVGFGMIRLVTTQTLNHAMCCGVDKLSMKLIQTSNLYFQVGQMSQNRLWKEEEQVSMFIFVFSCLGKVSESSLVLLTLLAFCGFCVTVFAIYFVFWRIRKDRNLDKDLKSLQSPTL